MLTPLKGIVRHFKSRDEVLDRTIDLLALLSVVVAMVDIAFRRTPELFSGQGDIGLGFYDLALAYLSAWIFNLLVVDLPRVRRLRGAYRATAPALLQVVNNPARMLSEMASRVAPPREPHEIDASWISEVLRHTDLQRDGSARYSVPGNDLQIPWLSILLQEVQRIQRIQRELTSMYLLLPEDLVSSLRVCADSDVLARIELYSAFPTSSLGGPILESEFVAYNAACQELALHVDRLRD